MRISLSERKTYGIIMLAAACAGLLYVITSHISFVINAIKYSAVTLTNISTGIFRLECLVLPLAFMMPRNRYFPKILLLKCLMILFCITGLAGVMWVFQYLNYISLREIFDSDKMYLYQGIKINYIAANRFLWGNQGFAGVVLSFILSVMYGVSAALIHKHRHVVAVCFSAICAFRLIAPMICIPAGGDLSMFGEWFGHNAFWIISGILLNVAIWRAAKSDAHWINLVWSEMDMRSDDD
ncbi:MAG: hypothetical protein IJ366_02900 [Clostridia bacterium]|nr:hypothetical protein [Clostridia bacterium]